MQPMALEGSLTDSNGTESVTWLIADADLPGWQGRYLVSAEIRGVRVSGVDFTGLEPDGPTSDLPLNTGGEIDHCELTVAVPTVLTGSQAMAGNLVLTFHLGAGTHEPIVDAALHGGPSVISVSQEERLEDVLGGLVDLLVDAEWQCCLTCGLSDYSPGGNGNMGMRCHRDSRSLYLSSRGKWEYWAVPVTEEVPEFYRCDAYERRRPGTGYRG